MKDASTSTTYYRVADACCRVATNVMVEREHEKKPNKEQTCTMAKYKRGGRRARFGRAQG